MKNILKTLAYIALALSLSVGAAYAATIFTVGQGGTGVNTITGVVLGNGTSPFTAAVGGTDITTPTGVENITNKTLDNTNTVTLKDSLFKLQDDGDTTKQANFQLSGLTTGTSYVYTLPNLAAATLATINTLTQTFSGTTTFSGATGTFGSSTAAGTYSLGSGATINAATRVINIGNAGVSGSIININAGSAVAGATGTFTVNSATSVFSKLTTNGFVTTSGGTGTLSVTVPGTGVATWIATPSSANLAAAITDETGSGVAVFGTAPTISGATLTTTSVNGVTLTTGGGTTTFLNANGAYSTPAGTGTVTSVATDATLTGGPITTTGTLGLNLSNANTWAANQTFSAFLGTTGAFSTANFLAIGGSSLSSSTSTASLLFGGAASVQFRSIFDGSASSGVGTNLSAASVIIGSSPYTLAATGTTGMLASEVINPIGTVTNGSAIPLTKTASLFVNGAGSGGSSNYALDVSGNSIFENTLTVTGHVTFESTTSTGATGTGKLVFDGSPTLVTPNLGTPSALTLTNATGLPIAGITGLGTGVATWLATPSLTNLNSAITGDIVVGAAATQTLTNKRITLRIVSTASSSTPTPNGDTTDQYEVTALAAGATFGAPTGTPTDGQPLTIRIKDNGGAQTLAWNAIYRASSDLALPTTTVISKTMYLKFIYNSADSKWDFVAYLNNF